MKKTVNWIQENQPKVVMLVDYPGFNLGLADALKDRGFPEKVVGRFESCSTSVLAVGMEASEKVSYGKGLGWSLGVLFLLKSSAMRTWIYLFPSWGTHFVSQNYSCRCAI